MIYLVVKDWFNTSKNHAGIMYLANRLERDYPDDFRCVAVPEELYSMYKPVKGLTTRIYNKLIQPVFRMKRRAGLRHLSDMALSGLHKGDSVVLMEYMDKSVGMLDLARIVRKRVPEGLKIYGMAHLVPQKLDKMFSDKTFKTWTDAVDGIITLGHSLTNYFVKRGTEAAKVHTTFHYVDDYYMADEPRREGLTVVGRKLSVMVQGNQMRDVELLKKIVAECSDVKFVICQGMMNLRADFPQPNVELVPFVDEAELRRLMGENAVSLNVMLDTIGSNVIVTSLGMAQAMVCSDVGSIRDYCDEENTCFCRTAEDFVKAIKILASSPGKLNAMCESARVKAKEFELQKFAVAFRELVTGNI